MAHSNSHLPSLAAHAVMSRLIHRALRVPGIIDIALKPRSPDQAARLGACMAGAGLTRLSDEDLERRAHILRHVIDRLSEDAGASLLRGPAPGYDALGAQICEALLVTPEHMIDDWVDISLKAMMAELHGAPEIPLPAKNVSSALRRAYSDVPRHEYVRMMLAIRAPQSASNQQLCEASRLLYGRALQLHPSDRALVLRALIAKSSDDGVAIDIS